MKKRDKSALDRRRTDPKFERLLVELLTLNCRRFGNLPIACAPITAEDLRQGKPPPIVTIRQKGIAPEIALARARQLMLEAQDLAGKLAAFFPIAQRWRWQAIFLNMALRGTGAVQGERGGGPEPTPKAEKIKIVKGWQEVKGRQLQENYAHGKGIDAKTLRTWERELREEGEL